MTRSEAKGFVTHAQLMLGNAVAHIKQEWDDPDVVLTPSQTQDMRKALETCKVFIDELEPYVKEFENVAKVRIASLTT